MLSPLAPVDKRLYFIGRSPVYNPLLNKLVSCGLGFSKPTGIQQLVPYLSLVGHLNEGAVLIEVAVHWKQQWVCKSILLSIFSWAQITRKIKQEK